MRISRLAAIRLFLASFLTPFCPAQDAPPTSRAHLTVDAGTAINTFRPADIFGINMLPYIDPEDYTRVLPKVQAAGTVFMRYPSGIADDVHWNSAGSFDAQGHWLPDKDRYLPSFEGKQTFRGTTSHYGRPAMLTDGDPKTRWLSNINADETQWVYVDLGSPKSADAVTVLWATPRATRFTVQYWSPTSSNQWMPYTHSTNDWLNTSAANLTGQDGEQRVQFTPVTSRYFRILLQASSAKPAQYSIAELTVSDGKTQLTRNVATVSHPTLVEWKPDQTVTVASSTDPACSVDHPYLTGFERFMDYARSVSPPVSPMITINCGGATPEEAAAWVHYANKVKGYGIRYWEIGNEMNGAWETGGPLSAVEYTRQYIAFYEAMKAQDPSIIIAGPGVSDADVASGDYDGKNYIQAFVDHLAAAGKADYANAIDFHWYPFFQNDNDATTWATIPKLSALPKQMNQWLKRHPKGETVPLLLSEYNTGNGTPFSTRIDNGLWLANTLGEYIRGFGGRGMASYWTVLHPADANSNLKGGDQSFFQYDKDINQYETRPTYWAMQLLSAHWAIAGDRSAHTLVNAGSDSPDLYIYADRRPDGILSLLVINRSKDKPHDAQIDLKGFTPTLNAVQWTWSPAQYGWSATTQPYHARPNTGPLESTETGISTSFRHIFPASSLTVLQLTALPPLASAARKEAQPADNQATTVRILPWNNHKSAISLTYDDGSPSHLAIVIPEMDQRGLKGTFNLIGNGANQNAEAWRKAAVSGHELASHSMHHLQPQGQSREQFKAEVEDAHIALQQLSNRPITTFAYPFAVVVPELSVHLEDRYVAARGGGERPQPCDDSVNWMSIPSFVPLTATRPEEYQLWLKRTSGQSAWCVIMFHSIEGTGWGWEPIPRKVYTDLLDSIAARKHEFWIAPFTDVASYFRAQKIFEAAAATTTANTTILTWHRPTVIPEGVLLKVMASTRSVELRQDGRVLTPDQQGIYTITFDAGNLTLTTLAP
jgi:peptidoglycan/xylan/chitin deacetylase (PgdA/CDA1 family)